MTVHACCDHKLKQRYSNNKRLVELKLEKSANKSIWQKKVLQTSSTITSNFIYFKDFNMVALIGKIVLQ